MEIRSFKGFLMEIGHFENLISRVPDIESFKRFLMEFSVQKIFDGIAILAKVLDIGKNSRI